jgi:Domain of unknown function (DUF222)
MAGEPVNDPDAVPTAAELSRTSTEQLLDEAAATARRIATQTAILLRLTAELGRREGWRMEGATSLEAWIVERCGASAPTARALTHVGERLFDLPHLATGLASGVLSLDKVRAVVDTATPETDRELASQASTCSVRQLAEIARAARGADAQADREDYEARSVRFNDTFRTVTAQLTPESFAEVRKSLETRAKKLSSDGETSWDQRLADAFVSLVRSGAAERDGGSTPFTVVAHVPLAALLEDDGETTCSELAGELERGGLLSTQTLQRLACDATLILAVDDDVGHTMYEGRAHRYPTETQRREIVRRDRHCRFPGCANSTFVNPHHIKWWIRDQGTTDLPNLALLCEHHHHRVHSKRWIMSGNANEELTFVGPSGRVMTSRPSPLWTTVTATRRSR